VWRFLRPEYEFHSSLSINNKECIVDSADGTAVAIADVTMKDIAKGLWVTDWLCVAASFRKSGCFTARENRVSTCVTDADIVLCERLEMFEDSVDVTKTKALLKEFSSDDFRFRFCRADSVGGRDDWNVVYISKRGRESAEVWKMFEVC